MDVKLLILATAATYVTDKVAVLATYVIQYYSNSNYNKVLFTATNACTVGLYEFFLSSIQFFTTNFLGDRL